MSNQAQKNVARLNYLRGMLSKYVGAYYAALDAGRGLSDRMYGWIDEYNDLRFEAGWSEYCEQNGFDKSHDAGDNFA